MSLSVKYVNVPKGFNRMVKINLYSDNSLLYDLCTFYYNDNTFLVNGEIAMMPTGEYEFDGIKIFAYNQEKQGFMYLYFESDEEYKKLLNKIKIEKEKKIKKINNPVYRFTALKGWQLVEQYKGTNAEEDIFGYDNYINQIEKDIRNHEKYNSFLTSVGEVRSINYLLYGPPGTGKTSLIRAIASKLKCSVFIVNSGEVALNNILKILSPSCKVETECKLKLLLFEDFDRFLETERVNDAISGILNTLDGFDDKGDTIRFFTANNQSIIYKYDALINRMNSSYEFYYPNDEIFRKKLLRLLSFYGETDFDSNSIDKFIELVLEKNITVRPFTNYVIRYLFDENCIDKMIENIDQLK
jgi:hypothetical protein